METEDRWYVRFRGHTLGPLTSEQVKSSVRRKELGPDDKLASTRDPAWRALRTEGAFLRCWESLSRPMPAELAPLPSPKILWQKKRSAQPAAPAKAEALSPPVPEPVVTQAPLPKPEPKASPKAAPRAAAKSKNTKKGKKPVARPAAKTALAGIPEKPAIQSITENIPAAAPPVELEPAASKPPVQPLLAQDPKLAEETLSLLEALRDWNRKEHSQAQEKKAALEPSPAPAISPIPAMPVSVPATMPVFETAPSATEAPAKQGIELRLNLTVSKQFIYIFSAVAAIALAAIVFTLTDQKKMRGPADFRLPDPSSPTIDPSSENDPIPQLKAPTRPKRD